MKSRNDNVIISKEDISTSQGLVSSWNHILRHCLKSYPAEAINCDEIYKHFERQKQMLESQEEHYLAPLGNSIHDTKEQFNKFFDPIFASPPAPIEKLPEESQILRKKLVDDTDKFVNSKRQFEEFRNNELKQTVLTDPDYSSTGFTDDWSRKFASKEINTMLKIDLHQSDNALKSIDKRISDNKSAPYVSTPEMFNDQLRKCKV